MELRPPAPLGRRRVDAPADPESAALRDGALEVEGRLAWSSNAALLVTAHADGIAVPAIYKPRRGERPLWDFSDGTLCNREVAAYALSEMLGWSLVPESVLRGGPAGVGMVQRFVNHDPDEHYFTLLAGREDIFRQFAVFDILANNADRKGGHCLRAVDDGHVWGIDHGLTFHTVDKLRTVIWDFAGERVPGAFLDDVCRILAELDGPGAGPHVDRLVDLLAPAEVAALADRGARLVHTGRFPEPDDGYRSVPWPLV